MMQRRKANGDSGRENAQRPQTPPLRLAYAASREDHARRVQPAVGFREVGS